MGKTGQLISLSEQELMDCSKEEGNNSCEGGLMDYAFEFVIKSGICLESDYPYDEADHYSCKTCDSKMKISAYKDVDHTEDALMKAITQQPVSIAIEADQSSFQFYNGGVLTSDCGTQLDHGVLAVGYGTENGVNYWKVKNSWGATWGDGLHQAQPRRPTRGRPMRHPPVRLVPRGLSGLPRTPVRRPPSLLFPTKHSSISKESDGERWADREGERATRLRDHYSHHHSNRKNHSFDGPTREAAFAPTTRPKKQETREQGRQNAEKHCHHLPLKTNKR